MSTKPESYCYEPETIINDSRVNILVVDDLPEKLLAYETILEELGHNLVTARSGEEALKIILKQEFAVILLDVNMPVVDGFETAALIRKRKKSAHTPIIFLTAFSDEMKIAQGYASGAVDYLFTPVMPDVLRAKVRVFIELFQMRQQVARQAEEHARRLAAEEADRCKDEFLGMLAHELRNPLGPILNGMRLLQITGPKDTHLEEIQQMIYRQVTHMVRLIDDLLDSTRLAQGKILLRKENCSLPEIIRQTADVYRNIFEENGLELLVEIQKGSYWIDGDSTRLVQALGNLLHNAHKFTNPGGKVWVRLERTGRNTARIVVEDTGIGISQEILPHIFDIFRQAEQGLDRNRGGLGLGLSLVRGLVDLHEGRVTAASAGLGMGATFTIELPLLSEGPAALVEDNPGQILNKDKHRILLVEDNKDAARSLDALLRHEGHQIRTAHNGHEGLKAVNDFAPSIILCDIGLPCMDGYQFVRMIRDIPALRSVYAVAISGYGRKKDIQLAYDSGFNMHLTKPVDYTQLCQIISNLSKETNDDGLRTT